MKYTLHPWHGISVGEQAPEVINAYIEIVPVDTVKYEIDKESGFLKIDRPQLFSNTIPSLYGFVPHTYCGAGIAKLAQSRVEDTVAHGDGDPLDICVFSSHTILHGNILLKAKPIGGLCLIDKGEADDKIIAVLEKDAAYGHFEDISEMPKELLAKLKHYFLTYKNLPNQPSVCKIGAVYGKEAAYEVIKTSISDYKTEIEPSIKA